MSEREHNAAKLLSANNEEDSTGDWEDLASDSEPSPTPAVEPQKQPKSQSKEKNRSLYNIYINGKNKMVSSFYNWARPFPSDPPRFSSSPIFFLGVEYSLLQEKSLPGNKRTGIFRRHKGERRSLDDVQMEKARLAEMPPEALAKMLQDNHYGISKARLARATENSNAKKKSSQKYPHASRFMRDFGHLLWFTYRKDFPMIKPYSVGSDVGWGCMLRTGQMLLARAFIALRYPDGLIPNQDMLFPHSPYRQILRWFADAPGPDYPYSIHNIMQQNVIINGKGSKERVGEWFAPTSISIVLQQLSNKHESCSLVTHVARDGVVYIDQVLELATITPPSKPSTPSDKSDKSSSVDKKDKEEFPPDAEEDSSGSGSGSSKYTGPTWRPILIIIPIRVGINSLNKIYINHIKFMLRHETTLGIIGGKPKASLYFVGYQDSSLIYLDPHFVQPAAKLGQKISMEHLRSYHCKVPQVMPIDQIDPSLAVAFLCKTRDEFFQLVKDSKKFEIEPSHKTVFNFVDESPSWARQSTSFSSCESDQEALERKCIPPTATEQSHKKTQYVLVNIDL